MTTNVLYLGFVIALLSIAIAVGVGLIVHFAENRKIECTFPDGFNSGGGNIQAQSGGEQQPLGFTSGKTFNHFIKTYKTYKCTVVPAKSDSDVYFVYNC